MRITFRASEPALTSLPNACFLRPTTRVFQRPPGRRLGREVLALLYDRTEGRAPLNIDFSERLVADPAAEITAACLAKLQAAATNTVFDASAFDEAGHLLESDDDLS